MEREQDHVSHVCIVILIINSSYIHIYYIYYLCVERGLYTVREWDRERNWERDWITQIFRDKLKSNLQLSGLLSWLRTPYTWHNYNMWSAVSKLNGVVSYSCNNWITSYVLSLWLYSGGVNCVLACCPPMCAHL